MHHCLCKAGLTSMVYRSLATIRKVATVRLGLQALAQHANEAGCELW